MTAVPIGSGLPANDLDGGLLGAQFGYNIQRGDLVYGVEAAFSTANVDTGSTATGCSGVHCAYIDINWTASITARLGKSVNRTLYYGALGYATADVTGIDWDAGPQSASDRHGGLVLGVGVEHAFTDRLSGVVDYSFTDFSTETYDLGTPDDVDFQTSVIKIGLNYHF